MRRLPRLTVRKRLQRGYQYTAFGFLLLCWEQSCLCLKPERELGVDEEDRKEWEEVIVGNRNAISQAFQAVIVMDPS